MAEEIRVGVVTDDPAKAAPKGTALQISFMHYRPVVPMGAGALEPWDHFGTALLGLSFKAGDQLSADGSAVLIGPGIALAAKHVIEPVLPDLLAERSAVLAFSITQHAVLLWRVTQVVIGETDVVILRLDLASEFPSDGLRVATLTTRIPAVGEAVMIAGLRSEEVAQIDSPLGVQVRVGVGEVSAVYPVGRDRVMVPHPCVEVRCLTAGGMSGGPAFDSDGNLIGILTSSFEHEEGPSYASLWWPLAAARIETSWPPGFVRLPTTLLQMQQCRAVGIIKPEALAVVPDDKLQYAPWS